MTSCDGESAQEQRRDSRFAHVAVVVRYCSYGSESKAQADGCSQHVDIPEIYARVARQNPSNAALYAVGKITECRADAGPGCTPGETLEETAAILRDLERAAD